MANIASIVSAFLHFSSIIKLSIVISVREMFTMHSAFIYTDCLTRQILFQLSLSARKIGFGKKSIGYSAARVNKTKLHPHP